MKRNLLLFLALLFASVIFSREMGLNPGSRNDYRPKKYISFLGDTAIVVKPIGNSYPTGSISEGAHQYNNLPERQKNEKLSISFNKNIATYSIIEKLVADKTGRLFYIDGKANDEHLPMVHLAFNEMKKYDNTTIIQQTLDYLEAVGFQQDYTYNALLKHNTFPSKGYKYSLDSLYLKEQELLALKDYIDKLESFFVERNLDSFFTANEYFIDGGIQEVEKNIPKGYIDKMEKYYGEQIHKFNFYINPFDNLPYEPEFWHGNGPRFNTQEGTIANMISSAYLPLKKQSNIRDYQEFGFDSPKTIDFLITHEFGHSFVNHTLTPYRDLINHYSRLFYAGLSEKMDPQGYGDWVTCITEHIVRLGEIRIAVTNGDKRKADSLRKMHIHEYGFVLIPFFEKKIVAYENNRAQYPSFNDFVPDLLSVLSTIQVNDVRKNLGLPTKKYKITIKLKVPDKKDEVFIVGNQPELGNWNPHTIKMKKISDHVRSISLNLYPGAKFKFTKGSWETEGFIKGTEKGIDITPGINNNTMLTYEIAQWK